jgi:hypothetical protein
MHNYSNNLKIQESVLKLIESSLHLTVKMKEADVTDYMDVKLLQKFIYIVIVCQIHFFFFNIQISFLFLTLRNMEIHVKFSLMQSSV